MNAWIIKNNDFTFLPIWVISNCFRSLFIFTSFQIQDFLKFIFVYFRAEYQKCRNRVDILRTDKIFKKKNQFHVKRKIDDIFISIRFSMSKEKFNKIYVFIKAESDLPF